MWIVFGHFTLVLYVIGPAFRTNPIAANDYLGNLAAMAGRSMDIAVDTFFVLSAFLATFDTCRGRIAERKLSNPRCSLVLWFFAWVSLF